MMPNPSSLAPDAFVEAAAGVEYFTTLAHYQSIARRILAVLAGGGRFILLTGNPSPNGRLLSNALSKAASGTYTVIGVPCGRNLTRDEWRRLVPAPSGGVGIQEFSAAALLVTLGSPLPLYVLEDADQLSDEQLQEFFATWLFGEPTIGTAILAVSPAFLARLERPALSFLIEGLAARMLFQHLGSDEIETFLRLQLPDDQTDTVFSRETIAAIAAASGGDPALVNRLASRTLDTHRGSNPRPAANNPTPLANPAPPLASPVAPTPVVAESVYEMTAAAEPEETALQPVETPPEDAVAEEPAPVSRVRRGNVRRRLAIGSIVALGYFGVLLVLGSFIPRYFRPSDDNPAPAIEQHPTPTVSKSQTTTPSVSETKPAASAITPAPIDRDRATNPAPQAPAQRVSDEASPKPALSPSRGAAVLPAPVDETQSASPAPPEPSAKSDSPSFRTKTVDDAPGAGAASAPAAVPPAPAVPAESAALPSVEDGTAALVARGDEFLTTGDIVSARLYYERAANAGNGHAAMLMGETFDPAFLGRAGVRGVRGDADAAAAWYRRARDLGDPDAARRFELLDTTQP
jgi:hypothetical protein